MKLDNLMIELNTMIDNGSIIVGALGLSQDSVNLIREWGEHIDEPIITQNQLNRLKDATSILSQIIRNYE